MSEMGRRIGFGEKLLLRKDGESALAGEDPGTMPGREWMENRMAQRKKAYKAKIEKWVAEGQKVPRPTPPAVERWSDGHTANTSIGQGYVRVDTPANGRDGFGRREWRNGVSTSLSSGSGANNRKGNEGYQGVPGCGEEG